MAPNRRTGWLLAIAFALWALPRNGAPQSAASTTPVALADYCLRAIGGPPPRAYNRQREHDGYDFAKTLPKLGIKILVVSNDVMIVDPDIRDYATVRPVEGYAAVTTTEFHGVLAKARFRLEGGIEDVNESEGWIHIVGRSTSFFAPITKEAGAWKVGAPIAGPSVYDACVMSPGVLCNKQWGEHSAVLGRTFYTGYAEPWSIDRPPSPPYKILSYEARGGDVKELTDSRGNLLFYAGESALLNVAFLSDSHGRPYTYDGRKITPVAGGEAVAGERESAYQHNFPPWRVVDRPEFNRVVLELKASAFAAGSSAWPRGWFTVTPAGLKPMALPAEITNGWTQRFVLPSRHDAWLITRHGLFIETPAQVVKITDIKNSRVVYGPADVDFMAGGNAIGFSTATDSMGDRAYYEIKARQPGDSCLAFADLR